MRKNHKRINSTHYKIVLASLAALVISALPMLFLYLEDLLIFKLPHERTYAVESKTISGDSMYLSRALKAEYEKQYNYNYDPGTLEYYTDSPYNLAQEQQIYGTEGNSFFMQQLSTLSDRSIIPKDASDALVNMNNDTSSKYSYVNTGDGFIKFSAYYAAQEGYVIANVASVTLETKTGKITSLEIYPSDTFEVSGFDAQEAAQNYLTYLELSFVDDWVIPIQVQNEQRAGYASGALYSESAQMMLMCVASDSQIVVSAQYMSTDQMKYWQSYQTQYTTENGT